MFEINCFMSYYIIVRGPLGIGKSTIARALAKKLKADYYSIDKILEDNGLDKKDDNFVPEDFIKADEIVIPQVLKSLEKGKIVIFDGCFYFREQISHLEKSIPFKGYTFNLKAPVEICIERDKGRKRVYGEGAARAVHDLVSKFDYGINIDTQGKSEKQVLKEILGHLPMRD